MNYIFERDNIIYAFDTYFYNQLIKCEYGGMRRQTKKVHFFSKSKLLIPINIRQKDLSKTYLCE